MLDTELPCFKVNTIEHLKARLVPAKTELAAAQHMTKKIGEACSNLATFTTLFYDVFQNISQGIEYK
jgi:hypothetical protein